jgi:hypothetical protein
VAKREGIASLYDFAKFLATTAAPTFSPPTGCIPGQKAIIVKEEEFPRDYA